MALGFLPAVLSCIVSAFVASLLTVLITKNSKLWINGPRLVHPNGFRQTAVENQVVGIRRKVIPESEKLDLVIVKESVNDGAVCLDGSPPGYQLKRGSGNGTDKWIVYFEGGAWCYDEQACYERSQTAYGSTRRRVIPSPEQGLYSRDRKINPDFYNWNMAFLIYCDGSSFTGMRKDPVYFKGKPVFFRGHFVLEALLKDLLQRGLRSAQQVLLSGSSAGSLAVLLHVDYIKSRLPTATQVRAIADSGFFVDLKSRYGVHKVRANFISLLVTHNSTTGLHKRCVRRTPASQHWKCLFPQYFFDLIQTPVFVFQSAYDVWQIISNLDVVCTLPNYQDLIMFKSLWDQKTTRRTRETNTRSFRDTRDIYASDLRNTPVTRDLHGNRGMFSSRGARGRHSVHYYTRGIHQRHALDSHVGRNDRKMLYIGKGNSFNNRSLNEDYIKISHRSWHWQGLYSSQPFCTKLETETIFGMRNTTLEALKPVLNKQGSGLFLSPCIEHTQARYDQLWRNLSIKGKTVREAVHEWYFEKLGPHIHIGEEFSFDTCMQ